jgi:hypothetical protein
MKKSMHINGSIPVTITHVKENRKTVERKGEKEVLCGHDDHAGYIYKFIQTTEIKRCTKNKNKSNLDPKNRVYWFHGLASTSGLLVSKLHVRTLQDLDTAKHLSLQFQAI